MCYRFSVVFHDNSTFGGGRKLTTRGRRFLVSEAILVQLVVEQLCVRRRHWRIRLRRNRLPFAFFGRRDADSKHRNHAAPELIGGGVQDAELPRPTGAVVSKRSSQYSIVGFVQYEPARVIIERDD